MAPLGKPKRRIVVEPLPRETRPAREPGERPARRPKRREKAPA